MRRLITAALFAVLFTLSIPVSGAEEAIATTIFRLNQYPGGTNYPGNSGQIGYPGTPVYPGNGGQNNNPGGQGNPVHPGNPGYPGTPTPPTNPGNQGPVSDYNLYNYGHAKYASGNFNSAVIYFDQLLKQYPASQYADDAAFWRAKIRWEQKNYLTAISLFANFIRIWPDSPLLADAIFTLAQTEKAFGRINVANRHHLFEGAGHFVMYQQRFPLGQNAAEALFQAGECYEISGDYGSTKSYYYRVIDLYPNSAAAVKAREKLSGRY
ncbi:MAG: tetratricopeptide repeat protein [Candidatus Riflebacteria bacterium]|nr:tetratricopeptide repeat protein [Candidatus Riflebacteria bacterium]